jgi:CRISPR-associated endonuclease/helicase Cas3
LLGKVVILDEIHTYDTYTLTIIESLLKELLELHCTVIILSATLSRTMRKFLLGQQSTSEAYPLITAKTAEYKEIPFKSGEPKVVSVKWETVDELAIEECVARAADGQQVLWVENTVDKAQYIFKRIAASGIKVGLLHSRFIKDDRDCIEREWLNLYGKDAAHRGECGRVLVGTQILEQSIDIDADFLITRLAPIDMLFQRIGRLWRHNIPSRCAGAKREVWILAPEKVIYSAKEDFGDSAKVYAPYVLYRTFEELSKVTRLIVPVDIRPLIEKVYTYEDDSAKLTEDENKKLKKYYDEMFKKAEDMKGLAGLSLASFGSCIEENQVLTRYIEEERVFVVLAKKKKFIEGGLILTLLNGKNLLLQKTKGKLASRGEISLELLKSSVSVSKRNAPSFTKDTEVYLENYLYTKNGEYTLGIVGDLGLLEDFEGRFAYNNRIGYHLLKKQ